MPEKSRLGERVFRGIPASAGVCRGKVLILGQKKDTVSKRIISEDEIPAQINRLEQSLIQTRRQILEVQRQVNAGIGAEEASIFEAHLLVLEDNTLIEEVARIIRENKVNVDYAFQTVAEKYYTALSAVDDEYLRERAKDLRDVTNRVLNNLLGKSEGSDQMKILEPCVLVAQDLTPSTTALFDRKFILGFVTDDGSKTSHTAILARSMNIPAVVGLQQFSTQVETGQYVLIDGYNGMVILNPTDQTLFEYGQLVQKQANLEDKLRDVKDQLPITLDGHRITLSANIEQPTDVELVKANGAEGVGLFRTEYLYLSRDTLPSEEEQYQAYRQVAAALKPNPVIIRTLDLGGDKFLSPLKLPPEMNPFLGWRAIRFCLQEKAIFYQQLRAILRASVEGNVKILYPMICCLDELLQANALLEECRNQLRKENQPMDENMEVGVMVEVPSAALITETLARYVDFFSIGTNDLIQYSLAVDRLNEKIAHLYEPTHPAIVRLIKMTVDAAHRHGIWVGVCGEMAGDPDLTPLLLGLGVDELSAANSLVPQIKYLIRRLNLAEAKELADFALQCESATTILERTQSLARKAAPNIVSPSYP